MVKYSYEFKEEIVTAYIQGEGGKKYLANKYGVKSPSNIIKWSPSNATPLTKLVQKNTYHI